ncbi:MAG: hypothetical protein ACLFMO_01700 [Eubacteriales bacterium]
MSAAYYINLEREDCGIDLNIDGKGIAIEIEKLDEIAEKIEVTPLSKFFSINQESIMDLLGEEELDIDLGGESWFEAKDGLRTIKSILIYIEENNKKIEDITKQDLKNVQQILSEAVNKNIKWHLGIDI